MESRPKRKVKPVVKLSYDELGQPSDQPISIAYGGMLIRVEGLSQNKNSCSTLWCHPLARCTCCDKANITFPTVTAIHS